MKQRLREAAEKALYISFVFGASWVVSTLHPDLDWGQVWCIWFLLLTARGRNPFAMGKAAKVETKRDEFRAARF